MKKKNKEDKVITISQQWTAEERLVVIWRIAQRIEDFHISLRDVFLLANTIKVVSSASTYILEGNRSRILDDAGLEDGNDTSKLV